MPFGGESTLNLAGTMSHQAGKLAPKMLEKDKANDATIAFNTESSLKHEATAMRLWLGHRSPVLLHYLLGLVVISELSKTTLF